MLPTLSGTTSVQTNVSVLFIPSAAGTKGPEASGSAIVRVVVGTPVQNPAVAEMPTPVVIEPTPVVITPTPIVVNPRPTYTPAPAITYTPSHKQTYTPETYNPAPRPSYAPAPRPVSPADLSVHIVAVGVIDPNTGAFIARAPYSPNEISAVQFDIQNIGGSPSGSYTFQAQIPTSQPYTFSSQIQRSLAPSAHVINTLRFTPAVDGTFSVQVFGADYNTSNNSASRWVSGAPIYQQYNQYPQQYPQQYNQYPQQYPTYYPQY